MNEFSLFQLDDHHAIGQFVDKDGNLSWQMITTIAPIINNTIDAGAGFEYFEFDPNDFELNGHRVHIEIEKRAKE